MVGGTNGNGFGECVVLDLGAARATTRRTDHEPLESFRRLIPQLLALLVF